LRVTWKPAQDFGSGARAVLRFHITTERQHRPILGQHVFHGKIIFRHHACGVAHLMEDGTGDLVGLPGRDEIEPTGIAQPGELLAATERHR
jgi:hypothetical protein